MTQQAQPAQGNSNQVRVELYMQLDSLQREIQDLRGIVEEHRGQTHLLVTVAAIRQALRINVPAQWVQAA